MRKDELKRRLGVLKTLADRMGEDINDWKLYHDYFLILRTLPACGHKWRASERLKGFCAVALEQGIGFSDKVSSLMKEILLMEARGLRFDSYMQFIELNREPEKRFWLPRRKQLLPVVKEIQRLVDGKLDILSISLPPGTGKSTLEIFLLSMMIGAEPDKPNLMVGHSDSMAGSIYDGVLNILENDAEYLWHEVFPDTPDRFTNAKLGTIDVGRRHRFSSLTCASIKGKSLTGRTRFENILCADDLVSGIEEAMSIERLGTLWGEYTTNVTTRSKMGGRELHLATRWSLHDVIGRLERMNHDNPRAKFLVIPALDEKGKSNFDYDYGVGFDTEYFERQKKMLDDASFRALMMGEPIERKGTLYSVKDTRVFFEIPEHEPDAIIAICDTKDSGEDYSFLPVAYVYGEDYYIVDCVCDNGLPEMVDARLAEILLRHSVQMARFESNSAGGRIAQKVQEIVKAHGGRTNITTKFTQSKKETRIIVNSAWVKEHCLFQNDPTDADYKKMMDFKYGYTVSGKNKYDDVPDGLSMLSEFAQSLSGQKPQIFKRPF